MDVPPPSYSSLYNDLESEIYDSDSLPDDDDINVEVKDDSPASYIGLFKDPKTGLSYIDFLSHGVNEGFLRKPNFDRFVELDDPPASNSGLFNDPKSGLSYINFLPCGVNEGFVRKPNFNRFEDIDDPPPSYSGLFNAPKRGLCRSDSLPYGINEGFFREPKSTSFEKLIDCANKWLRLNPQWEIKSCASVEMTCNDQGEMDDTDQDEMNVIDQDEMTDMDQEEMHGIDQQGMSHIDENEKSYIRGLKLWLTPFSVGQERVQKIDYFDVVPRCQDEERSSKAKFETLDDVVRRFNNVSMIMPVPGRIITIETQGMKTKNGKFIDPERSRWAKFDGFKRFTDAIRIFYETGDPWRETIGITDFVPECKSKGLLCPKYESISDLLEKASSWCSKQTDLRICNIQILAIKLLDGVNSRKMSYTDQEVSKTPFVNIVRVAHVYQDPSEKEKYLDLEKSMQKAHNWMQNIMYEDDSDETDQEGTHL